MNLRRNVIGECKWPKTLRSTAVYLWLFTVLLFFRVIGQIVVVLFAPRWLPPMEQWQSGLLPYPVLLAGQAVVLTLMVWISADFSRGAGFFLRPWPAAALATLWFSYLLLWRDGRPLRGQDDAPAGPALARGHDSHHLSQRRRGVPVDLRYLSRRLIALEGTEVAELTEVPPQRQRS